jgi:type I restriction enzyme S subunit
VSFPRYPAYKDSGVEWLGEVPEHWETCTLKRIASLQSGDSITAEQIEVEGEYPVLGGNGLRGYTSNYTHEGHYVVIGRQGALCGNINYGSGKFWASEHAVVATPIKPVETVWLGELLRAMNLNQYSISAAQPGLSVEIVSNLPTVLPPLSDQCAIAIFLIHETAKIDALIGEQRRLIELLKEKRQAVISHAVTKGLDPKVRMKPSGIEWLGEIPAHWRVAPLMRLTPDDRAIMYGIVLPGPDVEDGVPIVKGGDVSPGRLNLQSLKRTTREIESGYERSRLRGGDIVYAIRGSIGAAELVPDELTGANLTQDAARVAPLPGVDVHWLLCALKSTGVFRQLDQKANGATIRGINIFDLKRARVPTPPPYEQRMIAAFAGSESARFDTLSIEAQRAIELLQERRTALISAAVTGKIDVRGLAEAA